MRASRKAKADIEKLLVWAYRDELSKGITSVAESNWGAIIRYAELGGQRIDGSAPQRYDLGTIHPDAQRIEVAACALDKVVVDWAQSRAALMGHLAGLLASRDVLLLGSINVAALVIMHAKMDSRPDWHAEHPRPRFVPNPKNHAEPSIIGKRGGRNLYTIGSHCPLRWEPSPITIALARADYAAWHHGLCVLADTLELEAHEVERPAAPAQPWVTGEAARSVYFAGGPVSSAPLPVKPVRKVAGPRPPPPRPSAVRHLKRGK